MPRLQVFGSAPPRIYENLAATGLAFGGGNDSEDQEMNSAGWNWAGIAAIWGVFTLWVPFVVLISSSLAAIVCALASGWTTFGALQEMLPSLKDFVKANPWMEPGPGEHLGVSTGFGATGTPSEAVVHGHAIVRTGCSRECSQPLPSRRGIHSSTGVYRPFS